jgi:hypothetical protein
MGSGDLLLAGRDGNRERGGNMNQYDVPKVEMRNHARSLAEIAEKLHRAVDTSLLSLSDHGHLRELIEQAQHDLRVLKVAEERWHREQVKAWQKQKRKEQ